MLLSTVFSLEIIHAQAHTETPKMMSSSASWSALFHGRRLAYTVLLSLSIGIHAVGLHMLATVLPAIVADLGGAAFYAWAMLLYWAFLQFVSGVAASAVKTQGGVAFWAHVGGFIAGVALIKMFPARTRLVGAELSIVRALDFVVSHLARNYGLDLGKARK